MLTKTINTFLNKITNKQTINDIGNINKYMNTLISNLYFYDKINYLINNRGKHVRSLLALYCYYKHKNNASYNINELYKILAIVELTHFASLLHDDVIDNSKYRRNVKSFNYSYGNKNSILIGDYILINNFRQLLQILNNKNYSKYLINQLIKASTDTAYGAYLEHNLKLSNNIQNKNDNIELQKYTNSKNNHSTIINDTLYNNINDYIKISKLKTGSLFRYSCITGCVLSNITFNNVKKSSNLGLIFGIIYQMQNDLDNYKYNNYKESEDYMQNNITLPIVILQNIYDIKCIFYNKNQKNFNKIKEFINTDKFKNTLNNITNILQNLLNNL